MEQQQQKDACGRFVMKPSDENTHWPWPESPDKEQWEKFIAGISMAAQDKARQQMAAEIHDHINPGLIGVKLLLDTARKEPDTHQDTLADISYNLGILIDEIRKLSSLYAPATMRNTCLEEELHRLADNIRVYAAVRIVLKLRKGIDQFLTKEQKFHVMRMVQEQLANVVRHAVASKVLITLHHTDGVVEMVTRDNGKGFDVSKPVKGIGLSNMLGRVKMLGGTMAVQSAPEKGTLIRICFPVYR